MQPSRPSRATIGRVSATLVMADADRPLPPERKPATFPGDDQNRVERKYWRSAGVGIQYAFTIGLLTWLGIWLDGRFETGPLFTVVLLLLGFVGATWSLVRGVLGPNQPSRRDDAP